jgi:hypothetical protein
LHARRRLRSRPDAAASWVGSGGICLRVNSAAASLITHGRPPSQPCTHVFNRFRLNHPSPPHPRGHSPGAAAAGAAATIPAARVIRRGPGGGAASGRAGPRYARSGGPAPRVPQRDGAPSAWRPAWRRRQFPVPQTQRREVTFSLAASVLTPRFAVRGGRGLQGVSGGAAAGGAAGDAAR